MNQCKTCKFWGRHLAGVCDALESTDIKAVDNPDTLFQIRVDVDDDSGLDSHLHTGPEFGCIHHSPKVTS